ncbi:MAG: hypothetical protein AB7L90_14180 [Hyphomicrobiaceae bacterium]
MTRGRWIATVLALAVLVGLLGWQRHRQGLMHACLDGGRAWNGPLSRCEPPRIGPILNRALERS